MSLSFAPLTPELWPVFEPFFAAQSETNNCWCMWWRRPATEIAARNRDALREGFRKCVEAGPPPGLVALDGGAPVGWVQITPRADLARFNRGPVVRPASGADLDAVWAVSCFFTAKSHRRQGLMTNLARAACAHAAQNGATAVEAAALKPRPSLQRGEGFVGLVPALVRAGFAEVEERSPTRVLMRWMP